MSETRQLHHQQEHQQADNEILLREGPLTVDGDPVVFEQEVHERIDVDRDIERDEDMVDHRRQSRVQVALLVLHQDLQHQGDRDESRGKLQRAAGTRVEVPDQPNEEDRRDRKYQVTEIYKDSDPIIPHINPPLCGPRPSGAGRTPTASFYGLTCSPRPSRPRSTPSAPS